MSVEQSEVLFSDPPTGSGNIIRKGPYTAAEITVVPLTWQQRLGLEYDQVLSRLDTLDTFLGTDAFHKLPFEDKSLLWRQRHAMALYAQILSERLTRANKSEST